MEKSIEDIYQKKTQLEHILLRPDTYIGSIEFTTEQMWVFNNITKSIENRSITYVPGLYKIFDEILVNAADNKQNDHNMDTIKVNISIKNNIISIYNNGKGIPIVKHKKENIYVPTLIFGHLLTSSNYDDNKKKTTGGKNGYGAKLCNIFSTEFLIETASSQYNKKFIQVWYNNMNECDDPIIEEYTGEDYTKIIFQPDLDKFKMTKLNQDIIDLISKRVYDLTATLENVKIYLNNELLKPKSFKDYVNLYINNDKKIIYDKCKNWDIALTISEIGFQQISFVNNISTSKGGKHVDYVCDIIIKYIIDNINKKNKTGLEIKPYQIKNHLWIFVNSYINNPTFDSQIKENMTSQVKNFGYEYKISDKFINSIPKLNLTDRVLSWIKYKANMKLDKLIKNKQTKIQGIVKLEDANNAGTNKSLNCVLILTEGDSAKTMAVSGLAVLGRDNYGIFPLKGKILNVRDATLKQIMQNEEINNIIKIIGLQYKKTYKNIEDLKTLRYGKIMIMTDQDQDGSHIKGLLINFIHHNWPELLKINFIEEFITPIIKASYRNKIYSFFSMPEFEEWKINTKDYSLYNIKYYKGLGTSTTKEAREYFSNMNKHKIKFSYKNDDDDKNIIMAFGKKNADERKTWLTTYMNNLKQNQQENILEKYLYEKNIIEISYSDFINKELILFSNYDNKRSIPNMIDGLKPGQRKVIYTCFKRNDTKEIKVAQLAGSVAELSAYHHGEISLMTTIISLAQNFVGSNNINLLEPLGQFGSRLCGGKDAASPRYIYTILNKLTKIIFNKKDNVLLKYEYEDNQKIEPIYFIPIIPMILVNGANGIGTGWMTKIPNYNPLDIIINLKKLLNNEEMTNMTPFYKNFKGKIIKHDKENKYITYGILKIIDNNTIKITELPIGIWTQKYKENVLENLLNNKIILNYKEYNTETLICFIITINNEAIVDLSENNLYKIFKLSSLINLSSMCAFDENLCLKCYKNVKTIILEFYEVRLKLYEKRKKYLENILYAEVSKLSNQVRFILDKIENKIIVENKKKQILIDELESLNYDPDPILVFKHSLKKENSFDYLIGMPIWFLTYEKKEELLQQKNNKITELENLKKYSIKQLWIDDLDELYNELILLKERELNEEIQLNKNIKLPI